MCSVKDEECLADGTDCPFMALTDTKFFGNKAGVGGGGIFVGYVEAIRFNCSNASLDTGLEFYDEEKRKVLKRLESEADICPSWKGNRGNLYGPEVGTYASNATMTMKNATRSVCSSGGKECVIDGYRTGEDLPQAEVMLLDGLGQGPATNYRKVNAMLSSADNEFIVGSVVQPMENGSCTFRSIKGSVPPGTYKLKVEFGEKAIKEIWNAVNVPNCSVGEFASAGGFCTNCSSTTFNFNHSAKECQPCPENGNCESRVITPNEGYWHKTPCSENLRRCLPTSACKFEGRSENLTDAVSNVTSCHFNETWIEEDYSRAQCAEVPVLYLLRIRIIRVFFKGSRGDSLRIMLAQIWFWPVGKMQEVLGGICQRRPHSNICSLPDRIDRHHRQWHTQRSEDGSQRASSPKCVNAVGRAEVSSFSR